MQKTQSFDWVFNKIDCINFTLAKNPDRIVSYSFNFVSHANEVSLFSHHFFFFDVQNRLFFCDLTSLLKTAFSYFVHPVFMRFL